MHRQDCTRQGKAPRFSGFGRSVVRASGSTSFAARRRLARGRARPILGGHHAFNSPGLSVSGGLGSCGGQSAAL